MSNELTATGTSALSKLANISNALAAAETVLEVKDGGSFIKFSKGLWQANGEDEIEDTDIWALNPFNMIHGFVDFDGDNNAQEKAVPITQPRPAEATLPPAFKTSENGWQSMIGIEMKGVGGEFDGETFMFKTNSYGGRKMMSDYLKQLQTKVAVKDENIVALVSCSKTSYKHDKWGIVFNPVLIYHEWSSIDEDAVRETAAVQEPEAVEEVEEPAPKPRRGRAKAAAVPVEEVEDVVEEVEEPTPEQAAEEAPRRRRRRRA